ncbi:hypothetical protein ABZ484_30240 [Streptomyces sp. NPDC006393]|uniref:hypothetical protein n=1 Tax=Streptomyces sp. NPDC006393 TaxID=3156763 RepID=UPI0033EB83DF
MPARSTRTRRLTLTRARGLTRARPLAATALLLTASAALTGCHDGQGVRDEGPSSVSRSLEHPGHPGRPCAGDRPAPAEPGTVQRSFCATSVAQ